MGRRRLIHIHPFVDEKITSKEATQPTHDEDERGWKGPLQCFPPLCSEPRASARAICRRLMRCERRRFHHTKSGNAAAKYAPIAPVAKLAARWLRRKPEGSTSAHAVFSDHRGKSNRARADAGVASRTVPRAAGLHIGRCVRAAFAFGDHSWRVARIRRRGTRRSPFPIIEPVDAQFPTGRVPVWHLAAYAGKCAA